MSLRLFLVLLVALARLSGADWQVLVDGVVEADRSRVVGLIPPASGLTVAWLCEPGARLAPGEPVVVWDSRELQAAAALAGLERRSAALKRRATDLKLDRELQEMLDERAGKLGELALVEARFADLHRADPNEAALRRGQLREAELALAGREAVIAARRQAMRLGELPEQTLEREDLELAAAMRQLALPRLRLDQFAAGADRIASAELALQRDGLRREIGLLDDGSLGDFGLAKRLRSLQARITSERKQALAAWQRALSEAHQATRDAWDHTPLRAVVFLAGDGSELRRIVFAPVDAGLAGAVDHGAPWSEERGWGWAGDRRDAVILRDGSDRPEQGGDGGGRGRGRRSAASAEHPPTSDEPFGVIVLRGAARWRCRVPPGAARVAITLGDDRDWQGAVLHVDGVCLLSRDELPAGSLVVEVDLDPAASEVVLACGDAHDKAQRAPVPGLGTPQHWVSVGHRARRGGWPYTYFTPRDAMRVRAVVHQDLAPLLQGQNGADLRSRLRAGLDPLVALAAADGSPLGTARILEVGQAPVPLDPRLAAEEGGQALDLLGRAVVLAPEETLVERLLPGQGVRARFAWHLPDGWRVLPAHLFAEAGEQSRLRIASADGRIRDTTQALLRLAGEGLGPVALAPGERLLPIRHAEQEQQARGWPGVVAAGRRSLVSVQEIWGRVAWQLPAGTRVEPGTVVMRLDNPSIEGRAAERAEAAVQARQEFLVAVQQRRLKTVEQQLQQEERRLAERRAWLAWRRSLESDAERLLQAGLAVTAARERAALDARQLAELATAPRSARELRLARLRAARSAQAARRAHLDQIVATRGSALVEGLRAEQRWHDARAALDGRELAEVLMRREEAVARLLAGDRLRRRLEARGWEREFERHRELRAPAAGRVFYLDGWNDHSGGSGTISTGFPVWRGMAVAEILDDSELVLSAEIPEARLGDLRHGAPARVLFDQWGADLPGRIVEVGQTVHPAAEAARQDLGRQAVGLHRVIDVRIAFVPPGHLLDELVPGAKGRVVLP